VRHKSDIRSACTPERNGHPGAGLIAFQPAVLQARASRGQHSTKTRSGTHSQGGTHSQDEKRDSLPRVVRRASELCRRLVLASACARVIPRAANEWVGEVGGVNAAKYELQLNTSRGSLDRRRTRFFFRRPTKGTMSFRILPRAVAVCVCAITQFSCATEHSSRSHAAAGQVPSALSVPGNSVTVGMHRGSLRDRVDVEGFRITQLPIRISDYQQCVAKGACQLSTETTTACEAWADESRASEPAACLSVAHAKNYCEWIGGRLPTVAEWLLAARGPEITRFPWGAHVQNL
jgi:formylglycine-generating enzyme required for sulfatase activity